MPLTEETFRYGLITLLFGIAGLGLILLSLIRPELLEILRLLATEKSRNDSEESTPAR